MAVQGREHTASSAGGLERGFYVGQGTLVRLAEIPELLHIAIAGELFEDGSIGDRKFLRGQRPERALIEFDGFDGLGQLELRSRLFRSRGQAQALGKGAP